MIAPHTDDRCTQQDDQTLAQIESLPWVIRVTETDRDDATHVVTTELSALRTDHELHTLANTNAQIRAVSQLGDYGCRVFVTV